MKKILLLTVLSLTCVACDRKEKEPTVSQREEIENLEDIRGEVRGSTTRNVDADNTGRNVRDRDSKTTTPFDQSESENDRAITRKIRQALISDSALSINAKNIKVITIDGAVTLRGPVANRQEKEFIERKASEIQGVTNIDNQLEITRNP